MSPKGVGYVRTPGIYSPEQVAGWKAVTTAVHQAGSKIFLQLWHVGRVSHSDFHGGDLPVAPSALPVEGNVHTPMGKKKIETPRALELEEMPIIIEQFRKELRMQKLQVLMVLRSMEPMDTYWISFLEMDRIIGPINMAAVYRTVRVCRSKSVKRLPMFGVPTGWGIEYRHIFRGIRCLIRIRVKPFLI